MSGSNIAFIPFRSGSTRLSDKNILLLDGLPLASWTLIVANKCKEIDKIILSTDSKFYFDKITKSAENITNFNKDIIFDFRSADDSGSKIKIFDYIKFKLNKNFVNDNDNLIQMLPTSPFRNLKTLTNAINLFLNSDTGIFSASEYDFRINFAFDFKNGKYAPFFENSPLVTGDTQSQNHPVLYHPCGTFNIFNMGNARVHMKTIYSYCRPFIVSREESLDIDTKEDFNFMNSIAHVFKNRILNN